MYQSWSRKLGVLSCVAVTPHFSSELCGIKLEEAIQI
jgi:hypothetical protein